MRRGRDLLVRRRPRPHRKRLHQTGHLAQASGVPEPVPMEPESGQPARTVPRAVAGAGGVRQRQQHETTGLPFHLAPVISRPTLAGSMWSGRTGYVQDVWQTRDLEAMWETKLTPANTHVFMCGNPAMIDEMEVWLQSRGLKEHKKKDPGQVHLEPYW